MKLLLTLLTTTACALGLEEGDFFPLLTTQNTTGNEFAGEPCGNNYCHHSSKCFEIFLADGSFEHVCDCTSAYTEDTYYAGEFCQYPSTQFCSGVDDPNGRQFCVNNGECRQQRHLACDCPEGFSGPRCAFQIGADGSDYGECQLPCQNGGTCQKGLKNAFDDESFAKFKRDIGHILEKEGLQHVNYEHCVCPQGFFGIRCEYEMEECGEREHLCLHGSVCVRYDDAFGCDCESSDLKTAGLFCENIVTSECEQSIDAEIGSRGFCTNGGKCMVDVSGNPTCTCPSGYKGPHCEFRISNGDVDPLSSSSTQSDKNGIGVFGIIGIAMLVVAVVTGVLMINLFRRQKRRTVMRDATDDTVTCGIVVKQTNWDSSHIQMCHDGSPCSSDGDARERFTSVEIM